MMASKERAIERTAKRVHFSTKMYAAITVAITALIMLVITIW